MAFALADRHHDHLADPLQQDLDRRIAVAGDVLDTGAQLIGIGNPLDGAVVAHPQQNPAPCGVGKGHQFAGEGRGKALLVLQHDAFALLEQDVEIGGFHAHGLLGNGDVQFRHIHLAGDEPGQQQVAGAAEGLIAWRFNE